MSSRRIHILSVIDDLFFGGDENRLHAFGRSVDKTQFRHTVLTLMKEDQTMGDRYGSMRDQFRRSGIRLMDMGEVPFGINEKGGKNMARRLFAAQAKIRKLAALIDEEKVDILDVHLSPANLVCAVAALYTGIPFVVTLYQLNLLRSSKLWLAGQFNLGKADLLITDSEAQASLISQWLLHRSHLRVIPNGTSPPQPVRTRQEMLNFFDIPDRPLTIIGQVSSLLSYKGHFVLLDAAKRVLERHPECFFLMVGYERSEKGYRDLLLQKAEALGIGDRVRITGYPGPIGDVWSIIDIHVHASHLDSLPNALLEAMSLGKPSVITSVGGVPEVIKHELNGFLVPANNAGNLANSVLLLIANPALREEIGGAAQNTYINNFSPQVMTRRLEAVFYDIVARQI
jgi:glycosyltransferase involved in cell wall biosynthesis